jgi:hypothetical protein
MQKEFFYSLPNEKVGHACFEPMVPVYQNCMSQRSSQDAQRFRDEFYRSLPQSQRALLGFFTYYDHAIRSRDEFQRITTLYLSGRFFAIVKMGAEYFEVGNMQNLLTEIEEAFSEQGDELNSQIDELYGQLHDITQQTLMQIGAFIKRNPEEFIHFQ